MGNIIKLYHGSNVPFEHIDLNKCRIGKDFGRGFYTTENYNIARDWAVEHYKRHGGGVYIYMLKVDMTDLKKKFNVHTFNESIAWLDYIIYNRDRTLSITRNIKYPNYDVVIGKIADARTQSLIQEFCEEFIGCPPTNEDKQKLIIKLTRTDLKDQICFKTVKAIRYIESIQPNGKLSIKRLA